MLLIGFGKLFLSNLRIIGAKLIKENNKYKYSEIDNRR